ncbi:uncharacterized protein LOC119403204 [Rhipicephalus sanguineus]|uniref:uncharacterized protein LOC119403204 n=1 Tax=Rhipicephalus sanguineus TaxID=34632 RepID=UPI001893D317|nr:uncharacterized protein LOC119403204 [Rhipicephalus sanguineus]
MAADIHPYAVSGFSEDLDWSTLHFVKPFDDIRVCSACGVVATKTAFLPCRHVLCEPCYGQWKPRIKVCFLDGELCPENEVHWMEFPAEKLMKREVTCWNRENGCKAITDASSIAGHFHRECQYHSACCLVCSSTVLRRHMIAHLESHCTNYVLDRKSKWTHSKDFLRNVQWLRESLRTLELEFRNASEKYASLLSSLPGITATNAENHNNILTMAVEVNQVLELSRQTVREVERSRESQMHQTAKLKTMKEHFCAELNEIKRVADELGPCMATAQKDNPQLDEHVENLQVLQKEMQSLSTKLGELKNKARHKAALRNSADVGALPEVLSFPVLSYGVMWDDERIILNGFVRVIENALKVPSKVFWCVDKWSKLACKINANKFFRCDADVAVDDRYTIYLSIDALSEDKQRFQFSICVCETRWTILAASPKKIKVEFFNRGKGGTEYELKRREREVYLSGGFCAADLESGGGVHEDMLKVCFKFFY